jgi:ATP-binding cassette, subfamily B, bacterial
MKGQQRQIGKARGALNPGAAGQPASSRRVWALLWPILNQERDLLIGWVSSLLAAAAAALCLPWAFRLVIDQGLAMPDGIPDLAFLAVSAVALVLAITTATRLFCVTQLGERVVARVRRHVFAHLLRIDLAFHHANPSGELLSRLTSDAEHVRFLVGATLSVALRSGVTLLGSIVMLVLTSPRLSLFTLAAVPLCVVPIVVANRRLRRLARATQDRHADSTAIASEVLASVRSVQEYVREPFEDIRYKRTVDEALLAARKRVGAQASMTAITIALVFGALLFVLWLGAEDVTAHRMSAGALAQFIFYALFAGSSVTELLEAWGNIQRSVGAISRITGILQISPTMRSHAPDAAIPERQSSSAVAFEDVAFRYGEQDTLRSLSFSVAPGETLAIVGPSGAGKSTIFTLLLRFYAPQSGRILVNGLDVSGVPVEALRDSIAIVAQSPTIFSTSARENIRYGRLDATDDDVEQAARAANAHDFIAALPAGYDEPLGDRGVRLSTGQQQRIALARAFLKDADILLLDEATSALDARSERAVQEAISKIKEGRTTIIIAHRLATVMQADRILVLDHGRIVEEGTHAALLARAGLYAEFAKHQLLSPREPAEDAFVTDRLHRTAFAISDAVARHGE